MNYHKYFYKKHILLEYTNYCLLCPIFDVNIIRVNNVEMLELGSPDICLPIEPHLLVKGQFRANPTYYMTNGQFPQKNY